MGLGHLRAAAPLRGIANNGVLIYGSRRTTPAREYRIWKRLRRLYYASSKAGSIPVFGRIVLGLMLALERIRPYYPKSDLSRPNLAVKLLKRLIDKRGLCRALQERIAETRLPVVHTFYATAIALDSFLKGSGSDAGDNYLLICDADFNRVWVPENPRASRIIYLAPCTQVRKRLLAYGVSEKAILMTGFPLPKENIGSETGLEILKDDLFQRLLRLDPTGKFFSLHHESVLYWLGREPVQRFREKRFHLTFAVGGAGAQMEMVKAILFSLRRSIKADEILLTLSCGIQKHVLERVLKYINSMDLTNELDRGIHLIYEQDVFTYLASFNANLRRTDVLWTKPSELVFYSGLGLPILMAPPIGTHEELNKRWLREIHVGISPSGPIAACGEWLFDLWENGRFAEAAWDGFLKVRKLGTYKIERLIRTGEFREGSSPLDQ